MHAIQRCQSTPGRGKVIKRGMNTSQGQDAAYPQRRYQSNQVAMASNNAQSQEPTDVQNRTMLKAGSLLANRFPRLYVLCCNIDALTM